MECEQHVTKPAPYDSGVSMTVVGDAVSISGTDSFQVAQVGAGTACLHDSSLAVFILHHARVFHALLVIVLVVIAATSTAAAAIACNVQAVDLSAFDLVQPVGREFTPLYPLDSMLEGVVVRAPALHLDDGSPAPLIDRQTRYAAPATSESSSSTINTGGGGVVLEPGLAEAEAPPDLDALLHHLPFVQLVRLEDVTGGVAGHGSKSGLAAPSVVRVHLRLYSQLPCWGILNVTALDLVGWSWTERVHPSRVCRWCGESQKHMVRFTTQHAEQDAYWPFWLDVGVPAAAGGNDSAEDTAIPTGLPRGTPLGVRVELSVSYLHRTAPLRRVMAMLPSHTAESWLATVYQSYWVL
jgi:hypothetical protein